MNVEWDGSGGKPQDIRKEKNRTNSPMHSPARFVRSQRSRKFSWDRMRSESSPTPVPCRSALMSPKRAPTARPGRDRFTAESYTVLGESSLPRREHVKEQKHPLETALQASSAAFRSLIHYSRVEFGPEELSNIKS